jgi:hypothetical protein
MAEHQNQMVLQRSADADMSAKRYHIVRLVAGSGCNIASLATTSAIAGVLINDPKSTETAAIAYSGIGKVTAGGAVTDNVFITTDSSGRATAAGSGDMVIGRALQAAGATGEIITALLMPPFRWSGAV